MWGGLGESLEIQSSLAFSDGLLAVSGVGCGLDVVLRAACQVFGPVVGGLCAAFFGCAAVVRASGSIAVSA